MAQHYVQAACQSAKHGMLGYAVLPVFLRARPAIHLRLIRPMDDGHLLETPEDLLRQVAAARDRAAFGRLFEHFAPRIKAYLMRGGAAAQAAEDLAQEAMLAVWRKAGLFDPARASASTWIFTIARNLRIDLLRRERHPGFDPADPTLLPDGPGRADATLETRQTAEALQQALKALPPDQVEIVKLSFFSDKPHGEIAAELGLPLGTVKSRIRLAMARLRSAMGEDA